MGFLKRLLEARSWDPLDDRWYKEWQGLKYVPISGLNIDEAGALTIVAVYACVNLLASDLATLPLPVYRRNNPGIKSKAENHPLYHLLHDEPNSEETSVVWRQTMMAHTLLWGNGYSEIEFDRDGNPKALWPLPSWRVKIRRTKNRELYYEVGLGSTNLYDTSIWEKSQSIYGETRNLPPYAVFHTPALSISGVKGLSPVRQAMQAMGLAKAAEEMGARLFGQGANMGGIIEHPGELSPTTHDKLENSLNRNYTGLGKAHRIMLLDEGMKWQKVGLAPDEAQFLETRKFQRSEIASLFRIPPHMIGDTEKSTSWGTGIEQQSIGYVQHTLRPWLVLWEQEIKRRLLRYDSDYFAEFVVDGLLRGDAKARAQYYHYAILDGWMNRDEVRELENRNPIPDGQGQEYMVPVNEQSAEQLGEGKEGALEDAVREIAEREKFNLLRAIKKHPEGKGTWLSDFYIQFPDYIERQLEPVLGDEAGAFAQEYIMRSLEALDKMAPEDIEAGLGDWEENRAAEAIDILNQIRIDIKN